MVDKENFKLGLFVISGVVILIIGVAFMGLLDDFKPKAKLVTYVNESVQGLTIGSKVRFMGVPIGEVTNLGIILGDSQIRIDLSIDLSKVYTKKGRSLQHSNISKQSFFSFLQKEVKYGLACRIEPEGITGAKYIEISYYLDPQKNAKITPATVSNGILFIPSTPSLISNLKVSLYEIIASIAAVDFRGISSQLNAILSKTNKTIEKANLEQIVVRINNVSEKMEQIVSNIDQTISKEKLDMLLNNINATFKSIQQLSKELNQIAQNADIPEASASLQESLRKANETMDAVTDLVQELSNNPASLIRGKMPDKKQGKF